MGLFHHSSSSSAVCDPLPSSYSHADPISGTWTLYTILTLTGGTLTALTTLICLTLCTLHLRTYTNPPEQRQLIRIITAPAVFALTSFFGLWFYGASAYLIPIGDLYECFALVAIFYYMISIVVPGESEEGRIGFFDRLEEKGKDGCVIPGGSLKWFSKQWTLVFTLLPGRLLTTIIAWIVVARVCPTSQHQRTALLILNIFNGAQTALCVLAILRTYKRLRTQLAGHRVIAKLAALKAIVLVQLVQRAVFSGLAKHSILRGSARVSYRDLAVGVPDFMTVCEVFVVALFLGVPYSWRRYRPEDGSTVRVSWLSALVDVLNVSDIVMGMFSTLRLRSIAKGGSDRSVPSSAYVKPQEYATN